MAPPAASPPRRWGSPLAAAAALAVAVALAALGGLRRPSGRDEAVIVEQPVLVFSRRASSHPARHAPAPNPHASVTAFRPVVAFVDLLPPLNPENVSLIGRLVGPCIPATQYHQPLLLSNADGFIPTSDLRFCAPVVFYGSCNNVFHKCLHMVWKPQKPAAKTNSTICLVNRHNHGGANIGHQLIFLPFLVHFQPLCDVVAYFVEFPSPVEKDHDWTDAMWRTLFPDIQDLAKVTSPGFRYVLPPVQPTAFNYNCLYPPGSIAAMKARVFQRFGLAELPPPGNRTPRLTLLKRKGGRARVFLEEDEVEAHLKAAWGYDVWGVYPERFNFSQQAALTAQADILLAPHGAAMANLYALSWLGCAIEVFPANFVGTHYLTVAASADYCYIPVSMLSSGRWLSWECAADIVCLRDARQKNITVELPAIDLAVNFCRVCVANKTDTAEIPPRVSLAESWEKFYAANHSAPTISFLHAHEVGGPRLHDVRRMGDSLHHTIGLKALYADILPDLEDELDEAYIVVAPHGPWLAMVVSELPPGACLVEVFNRSDVNNTQWMELSFRLGLCYTPFVGRETTSGVVPDDSRLLQAISACEYCTRRLSYPKLGAHLNYYLHTHFVVPDRYRRLFGRTNVG